MSAISNVCQYSNVFISCYLLRYFDLVPYVFMITLRLLQTLSAVFKMFECTVYSSTCSAKYYVHMLYVCIFCYYDLSSYYLWHSSQHLLLDLPNPLLALELETFLGINLRNPHLDEEQVRLDHALLHPRALAAPAGPA